MQKRVNFELKNINSKSKNEAPSLSQYCAVLQGLASIEALESSLFQKIQSQIHLEIEKGYDI